MGTLYLVRHGQASFGADNYDQLSPLGHEQGVRLGRYWARIGFAPLRQGSVFDFARRDFLAEMRDRGMALGLDRDLWHVPPPDLLFLNRKFGGLYLLATKLAARVDLAPLIAPYLA